MSEQSPKAPHFLRVVRALAKVTGVAVPAAAMITSMASGCGGNSTGEVLGVKVMTGSGGAGGAGGSDTTGSSGGYGGASMGITIMPDGGTDGGH